MSQEYHPESEDYVIAVSPYPKGPQVSEYYVVHFIDGQIDEKWGKIGPYKQRHKARQCAEKHNEIAEKIGALNKALDERFIVKEVTIGGK